MKKAAPLYKVLSAETKNAKENCFMYNSIIDFIENDTTKIKKILENIFLPEIRFGLRKICFVRFTILELPIFI